jgi:hypothetical protein
MLVIEYNEGKAAAVKFRKDWDRTKIGTGYAPPLQRISVFRDAYALQTLLLVMARKPDADEWVKWMERREPMSW